MTAFVLSLALFAFWSFVGYPFVSLLNSRRNLLRNALLSPAVGLSLTVLCVIWINRLGLPVKSVAGAVTAGLVLISGVLLWRIRPVVPGSRLRPFLWILLLSAVLTGYPMFLYGFNWVSYCNDDMANYSLASKLFLNHAYFATPDWQNLIQNRDASIHYWYLEVFAGMRVGSEQVLAWVCGVTGLTAHQIFMPCILALQLVLIAATGAMVLRSRARRTVALLVCFWTAVSALVALGTVYQLIAQVFGLSLLTALSALLLVPFRHEGRRLLLRVSILRGLVAASLCVVYPELLPFAVLALLAYHALLLIRRRESFPQLSRSLIPCIASGVVLASIFLPGIVTTLLGQATNGTHPALPGASLFPYYLMPSGFAYLWGFSFIGGSLDAISLNIYIAIGMVLLAASLAGTLVLAWQGEGAAFITLIMAAVALRLFMGRMDFGLFKVTMYIQPFLIASAVLVWHSFASRFIKIRGPRARPAILAGPVVLLAVLGMRAEAFYVVRSTGTIGSGFVEIPNASQLSLVSTLEHISRRSRRPVVVTDSANVVLQKFESFYLSGSSFCAPAFDYLASIDSFRPVGLFRAFLHLIKPSLEQEAIHASEVRESSIRRVQFDMHGARSRGNDFAILDHADEVALGSFSLMASGPLQDIVNRRIASRESSAPDVRLVSSEQIRNHLLPIVSYYGTGYFSVQGRAEGRVAMYQLEKDLFFPRTTMAAIGRDLMFQVLRPSKKLRMVLEYTATLNADGNNAVPPVSVIGDRRVFIPVEGRGSARLFSPPAEPQTIEKGQYIALDMGVSGSLFPAHRWGMMRLFGNDLPYDPRRIVGFGRDISAISDEDYQTIHAPSQIQRFPDDLANKNLEYSGMYEDGWVAESSYSMLAQPEHSSLLAVSFSVPAISGMVASSEVRVLLDGKEVARKKYTSGDVKLRAALPSAPGRHKVELLFDRALHLPSPDNRPASAQLRFVGFQSDSTAAAPGATADGRRPLKPAAAP